MVTNDWQGQTKDSQSNPFGNAERGMECMSDGVILLQLDYYDGSSVECRDW